MIGSREFTLSHYVVRLFLSLGRHLERDENVKRRAAYLYIASRWIICACNVQKPVDGSFYTHAEIGGPYRATRGRSLRADWALITFFLERVTK